MGGAAALLCRGGVHGDTVTLPGLMSFQHHGRGERPDVFTMKMYFPALGDYEMNNHVGEYELDRRIGWEPEAGRGHPDAAAEQDGSRWGHRWSYELVPDGTDATIVTEIYDCSRAPADARAGTDDGEAWAARMARTLERLDAACTPASSG
jgi:hypothetical protein